MKAKDLKIGYIYEDFLIKSYKRLFEVTKIENNKIIIKYLTGSDKNKEFQRFTIHNDDDDLSYIKEIGKVENYPEYFV